MAEATDLGLRGSLYDIRIYTYADETLDRIGTFTIHQIKSHSAEHCRL